MDKKEKEERKKKIISFIIFILLLHIVLVLTKITRVSEDYVFEDVLVNITESYSVVEEVDVESCYEGEYAWRDEWEGWISEVDNMISPQLRLVNLEDRAEEYKVHFAFFDWAKYPYDEYRGKEYSKVEDRLSWDYADMHSEVVTITLDPKESVLLAIPTEKYNKGATYWAYADIIAPTRVKCFINKENQTVNKNRTYTNTTRKRVKKEIVEQISLWDFLISWVFG